MKILESLAILEAAVLGCKNRNVNTAEVKDALDSLERYVWPNWLIPQFRYSVENEEQPLEKREGQQQVLRATFPGIRNCVRELLGVRTDALARKFHETHDMAVKDEIERGCLKSMESLGNRGVLGDRQIHLLQP
jgi:hypothetical protein